MTESLNEAAALARDWIPPPSVYKYLCQSFSNPSCVKAA
jgi:hypothetical protein